MLCFSYNMKLKRRKLIVSALFLLCWLVLLVIAVDLVLGFETLASCLGSVALTEAVLLFVLLVPALAVYRCTHE